MLKTNEFVSPLESRLMLTSFNPVDGAAFSAALASAQLGDTIILNAGSTYTGHFVVKNKTTGSGWITIQSSALSALPTAGVRVSPADAANMPKIVAPGGNVAAIEAEYPNASGTTIGAHHFKFIGLEIVGPADNSGLVNLVSLGTTDAVQDTLQEMPHDFVIDRCYLHANFNTAAGKYDQALRRAIALNSGATDITNCYISEIHENGSDSQAIGGSNGSGPYNIINNHLEAASENILFGGSGCYIPNTIPSDIEIRGNYFVKPISWQGVWDVKNLFELKEGRRITIEGNLFENNWVSAQDGTAIVIKLDQYNSARPWQVTEDITFKNNIVRHAANALVVQGRDWEGTAGTTQSPPGLVRRINILNNLWYDIQKTPWATWQDSTQIGGNFVYLTQGPLNVTIDHNTVINGRTIINVDSPQYPTSAFVFTNNITAHNTYGVFGTNASAIGDAVIQMYFSDADARFKKNILMDTQAKATFYDNATWPAASQYYPSVRSMNYFPTTWTDVGFVDQVNDDYHLAASSAYNNLATDGTDLGADIDTILHATAGDINGIWFVYKVASTMYVKFGDGVNPISLTTIGSSIRATEWVTSLDLAGVTSISVIGSTSDDRLQLHAPVSPPMSFDDSGGNDLLEILSGTQTFASNIGNPSQSLAVLVSGGASAIFNATQRLRSLSVDGSATLSAGGAKVLRVKDLAVTGSLNLNDNDLLLDYTGSSPIGSWNGSHYTGVTGLIAAGRDDGAWNGSGIVTTMSAAVDPNTLTNLAVAEATDVLGISGTQTTLYAGQTVDASTVIVKYTYSGDANLDGQITGDDYFQIDSAFPQNRHGWLNGDFNFDGIINGDDYFLIDSTFPQQGAAL